MRQRERLGGDAGSAEQCLVGCKAVVAHRQRDREGEAFGGSGARVGITGDDQFQTGVAQLLDGWRRLPQGKAGDWEQRHADVRLCECCDARGRHVFDVVDAERSELSGHLCATDISELPDVHPDAQTQLGRALQHRSRLSHAECFAIDISVHEAGELDSCDAHHPVLHRVCVGITIAVRLRRQRMQGQVGGHHAWQCTVVGEGGDGQQLSSLGRLIQAVTTLHLDRRYALRRHALYARS